MIKTIFIILLSCFFLLTALIFFFKAPYQKQTSYIKSFDTHSKIKHSDNEIKVITYNIGYASGMRNNEGSVLTKDEVLKNLDDIVQKIKVQDADVICLQEVDINSSRSFGIDQVKYLAEKLGYKNAAYTINWNLNYLPWPYWPIKKQFGRMVSAQAVLTNFEIIKNKTFRFKKPKANAFWYNWFYIDRIAQQVQIKTQSEKINIWNVHLEAFDEETRLSQGKTLAFIIKKNQNLPNIMAGDFNTPGLKNIHSKQNNAVKTLLKSADLQTDVSRKATYPTDKPVENLDHILYDNHFQKLTTGLIDSFGSDHLGVWMTLKTYNPN